MGIVIQMNPVCNGEVSATIDVSRLKRKLSDGLIQPAAEEFTVELAGEHAADPIKDLDDIMRISEYLIHNGRYRDNMFFILGINFGLRVSDLLKLRFAHLIDESNCFRTTFPILEQKTSHTRKTQKNRYISINQSVMDAVTLYLQHSESKLDDYLFRSERNIKAGVNKPITRCTADLILKGIAEDLGLDCHVSTHTLRKTFGYHQMLMSNNDPRKLLLLQKIFGHSSAGQTLDYIGITEGEIEDAYMTLNLGSPLCYQKYAATFSAIS